MKTAIQNRASGMASRALARGDLTRGPCLTCGATSGVIMHHDDYTKPLDVTWLCRKGCHGARHREIGKGIGWESGVKLLAVSDEQHDWLARTSKRTKVAIQVLVDRALTAYRSRRKDGGE